MQALKIIGLAVLASVVYGIAHDNVTARLCVEYFTIGHPKVIESQSPTQLALAWGVIATWWMGVILGVPAALCARLGKAPRLTARNLLRPIGALLIVMAACSTLAGLAGYLAASAGSIPIDDFLDFIPPDRQVLFFTDLCAHNAAYAVGFFGGVGVCVWILWKRSSLAKRAATAHPNQA